MLVFDDFDDPIGVGMPFLGVEVMMRAYRSDVLGKPLDETCVTAVLAASEIVCCGLI